MFNYFETFMEIVYSKSILIKNLFQSNTNTFKKPMNECQRLEKKIVSELVSARTVRCTVIPRLTQSRFTLPRLTLLRLTLPPFTLPRYRLPRLTQIRTYSVFLIFLIFIHNVFLVIKIDNNSCS